MMAFPTAFHPEDCNLVKKRVIEDWILSNVDYTRLKDGFPVCFHRDVSFYFTSLHYFQGCSLDEKRKVLSSVLDSDVRDALEASGIINWCCSLPTVLPVNVSSEYIAISYGCFAISYEYHCVLMCLYRTDCYEYHCLLVCFLQNRLL